MRCVFKLELLDPIYGVMAEKRVPVLNKGRFPVVMHF